MNQQNPKSQMGNAPGSQFESSGFGGSMFASQGNSQFGGAPAGGNSGFPASGGPNPNEFGTTNFGGTNAVSQIFKDGGFGGDNRKKYINYGIIAVLVIGAFVGAMWYMSPTQEEATLEPVPTVAKQGAAANAQATPAVAEADPEEGELVDEEESVSAGGEETAEEAPSAAIASGSWAYNEEEGGPIIQASAGASIEVSLNSSFSTIYVTGKADGSGQFQIPSPPPGSVYWREAGASKSNQLSITEPPKVSISFQAPGTLAQGQQVNWNASGPTSFYRVEFSSAADFNNLDHVISTSGKSATVNNVGAGTYFVRVSGFNTKAGRWDSSSASSVNVQ